MKVIETEIKDLKIIELDIYKDYRGFFVERYNRKSFVNAGIEDDFVQDNFSRSLPMVIRGLHFQNNPSQVKLVGCTGGGIWDVAVDIRKNSPTFGKYFGIELNEENGKLLYIPAGFAHGFCVLGDKPADVNYKVNNFFSKEGDAGIAYNDEDIAIEWPVDSSQAIISPKDLALPKLKDIFLQN